MPNLALAQEVVTYKEVNEDFKWRCDAPIPEKYINQARDVWLYDNKKLSGTRADTINCNDEVNSLADAAEEDGKPEPGALIEDCPKCTKGFAIDTSRIGNYTYFYTYNFEDAFLQADDWTKSSQNIPTLNLKVYKKSTGDDLEFPDEEINSQENPMESPESYCLLKGASPPTNPDSPLIMVRFS